LMTQKVIGQEVGSHINIPESEAKKFYEEHKAEFIGPESVALAEIVVSTEGKKEADLADLKKKADTARKRVDDGEDFGEIASACLTEARRSRADTLAFTSAANSQNKLKTKCLP